MTRNLILNPRPDLIRVEHNIIRTAALWPGADNQPFVAISRKCARNVLPAREVFEVVLVDRRKGFLDVIGRDYVTKSELMCPPLADQLITQTTGTKFAAALLIVRQVLVKVLAVPAPGYQVLLAVLEYRLTTLRER